MFRCKNQIDICGKKLLNWLCSRAGKKFQSLTRTVRLIRLPAACKYAYVPWIRQWYKTKILVSFLLAHITTSCGIANYNYLMTIYKRCEASRLVQLLDYFKDSKPRSQPTKLPRQPMYRPSTSSVPRRDCTRSQRTDDRSSFKSFKIISLICLEISNNGEERYYKHMTLLFF